MNGLFAGLALLAGSTLLKTSSEAAAIAMIIELERSGSGYRAVAYGKGPGLQFAVTKISPENALIATVAEINRLIANTQFRHIKVSTNVPERLQQAALYVAQRAGTGPAWTIERL